MKINTNNFNQEKFTIYFLLFLVYIITFYPLTKVGFTVGDDIDLYTETCKGHWGHVVGNWPYLQGRFYFFISRYIQTVPYLIDNPIYFDLTYILPIVASFVLFSTLIQRVFKSNSITLLTAILLSSSFQIIGFHSITTAYPFFFTTGFCFILASLHFFISFFDLKKKKYLYISAILMFIATLFYETFMMYYLVFFMVAIWKNEVFSIRTKENYLKTLKNIFPFIIGGLIYLIAYFSFQYFYPPKYAGASLSDDLTIGGLFSTATLMSKLSFPLQVFYEFNGLLFKHTMSLDGIFKTYRMDLVVLVQGLIVMTLTYYALNKYKNIKYIHLLWGFLLGICLVYIPLLIVSSSSHYYLQNWHSYVPTFFSFFGYTLSLLMVLFAILNLASFSKPLRIIFQVFVCVLLFWVNTLTQASNRAVANDMETSNIRFEMADYAIKQEVIPNFSTTTPICFEQAHNTTSYMGQWVTKQYFSWKDFFVKQLGKKYNFIDNYEKFALKNKVHDKVWVCFFKQTSKTNDAIMYFAGLKGVDLPQKQNDITCDTIIVLYYSPYKTFNVSIASQNAVDTVSINNIHINSIGNYHSNNIAVSIKKGHKCSVFRITGKNLIASTLSISNILNNTQTFYTKSSITLTEQERIDDIITEIKNNPSWYKLIIEKAKKENISIEEALRNDAKWMYDNERINK